MLIKNGFHRSFIINPIYFLKFCLTYSISIGFSIDYLCKFDVKVLSNLNLLFMVDSTKIKFMTDGILLKEMEMVSAFLTIVPHNLQNSSYMIRFVIKLYWKYFLFPNFITFFNKVPYNPCIGRTFFPQFDFQNWGYSFSVEYIIPQRKLSPRS